MVSPDPIQSVTPEDMFFGGKNVAVFSVARDHLARGKCPKAPVFHGNKGSLVNV